MAGTQFNLTTDWTFPAPRASVWDLLVRPEDWPRWWRAVTKVELIEPGDENGVGAYRRMTWRTALPYSLAFNMRTTKVETLSRLEGRADGELCGRGEWTLSALDAAQTHVRYVWTVEVSKPWMRLVAPLARPVFAWNHGVVMAWGREGLVAELGKADPR